MIQRRSKVVVMIPKQWLLTTYDRIKAYDQTLTMKEEELWDLKETINERSLV